MNTPDVATTPPQIRALPRWGRYPIPWFVTLKSGDRPEFRIIDPARLVEALKRKVCWICGGALHPRRFGFVIGPMCTVNRVSSEPPQHPECAEFAAQACPFLADPDRVRRSGGMVEHAAPDGGMIPRNPGVVALWICSRFEIEAGLDDRILFRLGEPISRVRWFKESRPATRAEVVASIESGCPALERMAQIDGPGAIEELAKMRAAATKFWPAASEGAR